MCYIDIQKAYDSVEYWAMEMILEKYGFNKHFIDLIMNICKDYTCNVILPYGLSDDINITRSKTRMSTISNTFYYLLRTFNIILRIN